uniref:diguanylate cyclase domain-containing protein n=2 Tax=Candidatus Planktophila sp. TaxID=2175601 RepID=UPI00404A1A4C
MLRKYFSFNTVAFALLTIHLISRMIHTTPQIYLDLWIYNAVPILFVFALFFVPSFNDHIGVAFLALAIGLWAAGSILSSLSVFYTLNLRSELISNVLYMLFYPAAFIALPRLLSQRSRISAVEILDSTIIALGLSSLGTALFVGPVLPRLNGDMVMTFFAIFYPVGDLILVTSVISTLLSQRLSKRAIVASAGIFIFAFSDFLFLWLHVNNKYIFGSVSDDGWLVGLALLVMSTQFKASEQNSNEGVNPVFVALSVFLSATLLGIIILRPGYFPSFILLPTLLTLLVAFIRMTIALRQARSLGTERILARTDELTGLSNRRKLIAEMDEMGDAEGSLLILDLDGFKPINDSFGHDIGDEILKQVAIRFHRALPPDATLARLGGDEFGVLLHSNYETSMEVARALHATMSYPFVIEKESIDLGVSIGIAANNEEHDLLRRADVAMYRAKRESLGVAHFDFF